MTIPVDRQYPAGMTDPAYILGEACDVREVLARPGVYCAPSGSPSYGALLSLVWRGLARQLGRRQLADGQLAIAVEVPPQDRYTANANVGEFLSMTHITVDDEVFANTLSMYADWREAWWREAIQNSVDANATEIRLGVRCLDQNMDMVDLGTDDDTSRSLEAEHRIQFIEVSCEDNGIGMDQETLATKFLAVGGTGKGSARSSAVGGFGEAKKLLIGLWVSWYLRTGQEGASSSFECVDGHGLRFSPRTAPPMRGTVLRAVMRVGEATGARQARAFVAKCSLPGIVVTMNGEPLPQGRSTSSEEALYAWQEDDDTLRNRLLDALHARRPDVTWDTLRDELRVLLLDARHAGGFEHGAPPPNYYDVVAAHLNTRRTTMRVYYQAKDVSSPGHAMVRVSGFSPEGVERCLYMFPKTFADVPGTAIIELSGDSKAMLLANRESLLRAGAGYAIEVAMDEWVKVVTADKRAALERKLAPIKYEGEGMFEASVDTAAAMALSLGAFDLGPKLEPANIDAMMEAMELLRQMREAARQQAGKAPEPEPFFEHQAVKASLTSVDLKGPAHVEKITQLAAWRPNFIILLGPEGEQPAPELRPETMAPELVKLQKFWAECIRFILINLGEYVQYGVGWTVHPEVGGAALRQEGTHWLVLNPYRDGGDHSKGFRSLTNDDDVALIYSIAMHEVAHIKHRSHYDEWGNHFTSVLVPRALWRKEQYIERIRKAVLARSSSKQRGTKALLMSKDRAMPKARGALMPLPSLASLQRWFAKVNRTTEMTQAVVALVAWSKLPPGLEEVSMSPQLLTIAKAVRAYDVEKIRGGIGFISNVEVADDRSDPTAMLCFPMVRSVALMSVLEQEARDWADSFSWAAKQQLLEMHHGETDEQYATRIFYAVQLGCAMQAYVRFANARLDDLLPAAEQVIQAAVRLSALLGGEPHKGVRASSLVSPPWGAAFSLYIPTGTNSLFFCVPQGRNWVIEHHDEWMGQRTIEEFERSCNALAEQEPTSYRALTFDPLRGALR